MWLFKYFFPMIFFFAERSSGARILSIASLPTFSHNLFFRPIWKALADKGHQLTVLTANPMEQPYQNIHEIDLNYVYQRKTNIFNLTWTYSNWPKILETFQNMFKDVAIMELNHPEVQYMLKNETEHFDLVIAEMHIPLMFGFAHRYKCPLVGISSTDIISEHHALLGNPTHPIMFPETFGPQMELTLSARFMAVYFRILAQISAARQKPILQEILKMYFGPNVPSLDDLIRSLHFVFLNIHPVFNNRPLGSKFVTIGGGAHIEEPKALPKDLQKLLDNSRQGVVYFSLGTNVRIEQYPIHFINFTISAFKELPYSIIWKFNYELPNLPKNVHVIRWLPQQDLLRHNNVKAFITQGGIHSVEESINMGIPMIGIPFMSDQNKNIRNIVNKGIGIYLNRDTVTKDGLKNAIEEIIRNPRYKRNAITISQLFKDQPMTGLEKAIWYVEYAIRNKDRHNILLTNPNQDIPWYQYYFLDVIVASLLALCTVAYLLYKLLMVFASLIRKIISLTRQKLKKH